MERYWIKLPERQDGEPDISPEQIDEAQELIDKIAINDLLSFNLEDIGRHQAEVLINRLTDVWNGDLALDQSASRGPDEHRWSPVVIRMILIAAAVFLTVAMVTAGFGS